MARARNIKPAFFQNELLAECSPLERLAFIGMWTIADYKGCVELRPKRLKIQLLPYDDCDIESIAINLDKSGFVQIYSVQGQRYIKIVNFEKHQNPHMNEKKAGSKIPDISENDNSYNKLENIQINLERDGTNPADSLIPLTDSLLLIPDSPSPIPKDCAAKKLATPAKVIPLSRDTWQAYSNAYFNRYGAEPVSNAKINGQITQFIKRVGEMASPHIAAFYLTHNNVYYVREMHSVNAMLRDAEKLHTEWTTKTQMTSTKAMQTDKTQTNFDSFAVLIAEAEERERHAQ